MKLLKEYAYRHIKSLVIWGTFSLIFCIVFYLSNIDLSAIVYAMLLCFCFGAVCTVIDYIQFVKKHKELVALQNKIILSIDELPIPCNLIESDYNNLIEILFKEKKRLISSNDVYISEMIQYYTLWAHQIKTPLAAMRLILQSGEDSDRHEFEEQLMKIEQYVDMVLSYIKLDNNGNDLVLKNCELIDIVRQAVRKYAKLFIRKKISLELEDFELTVLTDEKWLLFVIEQIISNSIKYTPKGKIKIHLENKNTLIIEDTGIGIADEDLPRIFDKGFTGFNGRIDKKSTGIGLYLSKRIMKMLGHKIYAYSEINKGTKIMLVFEYENITKE